MSAECCDMFPRCKIFIPLVHTGTSTIISATKASLDLCHSMPRGVPHPIRFTSVRRPLLHLFLVNFPGNSVHLRSFVSEFVFEPIGVRYFGWVISHRYFAFCNKTVISDSVSQSIILWFQGASQPKISGADHQNYLNTHLFSDILRYFPWDLQPAPSHFMPSHFATAQLMSNIYDVSSSKTFDIITNYRTSSAN